jgi:hypothetical protein
MGESLMARLIADDDPAEALPAWIVRPFIRHWLDGDEVEADEAHVLAASKRLHAGVDAWLRLEGRRGAWTDLDLEAFWPEDGEPVVEGPAREILAQVFADEADDPAWISHRRTMAAWRAARATS